MKHEDPGTPQCDRRAFCNRILWGSAGVLLLTTQLKAEPPTQYENLVMYPPLKIEGAEDMMPGSFLYFSYPKPGDAAVLVRGKDSEYFAFSRKCAHLGCSVDFDAARNCLICPCHRGTYDARTGYVIYGPPPKPLDQIILQMRAGGEVWAVGRAVSTRNQNA